MSILKQMPGNRVRFVAETAAAKKPAKKAAAKKPAAKKVSAKGKSGVESIVEAAYRAHKDSYAAAAKFLAKTYHIKGLPKKPGKATLVKWLTAHVETPPAKTTKATKKPTAKPKNTMPLSEHMTNLKRHFGGNSRHFYSALGKLHDDKAHNKNDIQKALKSHFEIKGISHLDREHSLNVLAERHQAARKPAKKTRAKPTKKEPLAATTKPSRLEDMVVPAPRHPDHEALHSAVLNYLSERDSPAPDHAMVKSHRDRLSALVGYTPIKRDKPPTVQRPEESGNEFGHTAINLMVTYRKKDGGPEVLAKELEKFDIPQLLQIAKAQHAMPDNYGDTSAMTKKGIIDMVVEGTRRRVAHRVAANS